MRLLRCLCLCMGSIGSAHSFAWVVAGLLAATSRAGGLAAICWPPLNPEPPAQGETTAGLKLLTPRVRDDLPSSDSVIRQSERQESACRSCRASLPRCEALAPHAAPCCRSAYRHVNDDNYAFSNCCAWPRSNWAPLCGCIARCMGRAITPLVRAPRLRTRMRHKTCLLKHQATHRMQGSSKRWSIVAAGVSSSMAHFQYLLRSDRPQIDDILCGNVLREVCGTGSSAAVSGLLWTCWHAVVVSLESPGRGSVCDGQSAPSPAPCAPAQVMSWLAVPDLLGGASLVSKRWQAAAGCKEVWRRKVSLASSAPPLCSCHSFQ